MDTIEYKPENLTSSHQFLVRNWFDTVVKPIRNLMESQQRTLESKNLGFRHDTQRLEYLATINEYLEEYDLNLEQFLNFFPSLSDLIEKYNSYIQKLNHLFSDLFNKIENDKEFDDILSENNVEFESKSYFISYLLNSRKELFRNYSNFELYNKIAKELFEFINSKYSEEKSEIESSLENIKKLNSEIRKISKNIIMKLSLQTSTPISGTIGSTGQQQYYENF